jgi:hypothetical protein
MNLGENSEEISSVALLNPACSCYSLFGPSGVRALPFAAGINVGGNYFRYFAKLSPSSSFSWNSYLHQNLPSETFFQMEDDLNFFQMEDTLNFFQMEYDLIFFQMEDISTFSNGRRP